MDVLVDEVGHIVEPATGISKSRFDSVEHLISDMMLTYRRYGQIPIHYQSDAIETCTNYALADQFYDFYLNFFLDMGGNHYAVGHNFKNSLIHHKDEPHYWEWAQLLKSHVTPWPTAVAPFADDPDYMQDMKIYFGVKAPMPDAVKKWIDNPKYESNFEFFGEIYGVEPDFWKNL